MASWLPDASQYFTGSAAPNSPKGSDNQSSRMAAYLRMVQQSNVANLTGAASLQRHNALAGSQQFMHSPGRDNSSGGGILGALSTYVAHPIVQALGMAKAAAPAVVEGGLDTIGHAIHGGGPTHGSVDWQGLQNDPQFKQFYKGNVRDIAGTKEVLGGTPVNPDFYNKLGDNNPVKQAIDRHTVGGSFFGNVAQHFDRRDGLGTYVANLDKGNNSIGGTPIAGTILRHEAGMGDLGLDPAMYIGAGESKAATANSIVSKGEELANAAGDEAGAQAARDAANEAVRVARRQGVSALTKEQAQTYGLKQGLTFAGKAIPGADIAARSVFNPATAINRATQGAGIVGKLGEVLGATRNPDLTAIARSGGADAADAVRTLRSGKLATSQGAALADTWKRTYADISQRFGNDPNTMDAILAHAEGSPTAAARLTPEQLQAAEDLKSQMHDVFVTARNAGVPINETPNYMPRQTTMGGSGLGGGENASGYFERGRVITPESLPEGVTTNADVRAYMNEQAIAEGRPEGYYNNNLNEIIPRYLEKMGSRVGRANLINSLQAQGVVVPGMVTEPGAAQAVAEGARGAASAAQQGTLADALSKQAGASAADTQLEHVAEGVAPRGAQAPGAPVQPNTPEAAQLMETHNALYNNPVRLGGLGQATRAQADSYLTSLWNLASNAGNEEAKNSITKATSALIKDDTAGATTWSEHALTLVHNQLDGSSLGERSLLSFGDNNAAFKQILDEIGMKGAGEQPVSGAAPLTPQDAVAQGVEPHFVQDAVAQFGNDKAGLQSELQNLIDEAKLYNNKDQGFEKVFGGDSNAFASSNRHISVDQAKQLITSMPGFKALAPEEQQAALAHIEQTAAEMNGRANNAVSSIGDALHNGSLPPDIRLPRGGSDNIDPTKLIEQVASALGVQPKEVLGNVPEILEKFGSLEAFLTRIGASEPEAAAGVLATPERLAGLQAQLAKETGGAARQRLQQQIAEIAGQLGHDTSQATPAAAAPAAAEAAPTISPKAQSFLDALGQAQPAAAPSGGATELPPFLSGATTSVGGEGVGGINMPNAPTAPEGVGENPFTGTALDGQGQRALNPPPPGSIEDAQVVPNAPAAPDQAAITSHYAGYPPWAQRAFESGQLPKDMLHEALAQSDAAHAALADSPQEISSRAADVAARNAATTARLASPGLAPEARAAFEQQLELGQRAQNLYHMAAQLHGSDPGTIAELEAKAADAESQFVSAARGTGAWEGKSLLNPSLNKVASDAITSGTHAMLQGTDLAAPRVVADSLNKVAEIAKDPNAFLKQYQKIVQYVKALQLSTPGTALRHGLGAVINNFMGGVPFDEYAQTLRDVGELGKGTLDPQWEAKVQGLVDSLPKRAGQYSAQEIAGNAGGFFERHADAPFLDRLNPLSSHNAGTTLVRNLIGSVEDYTRLVQGMSVIRGGGSLEDAAAQIARFHFDFNDVTDAERAIRDNAIPFYTWTRKNLGLQLSMMVEQPGRALAVYRAQRAFENATGYSLATPFTSHGLGRAVGIGPDNKFNPSNLIGNLTPIAQLAAEDVSQHAFGHALNPFQPVDNKMLGGKRGAYDPFGGLGVVGKTITGALQAAGLADKNGHMSHDVVTHLTSLLPTLGVMKRVAPNNPKDQKTALDRWLAFSGLSISPERQRAYDTAQEALYKNSPKTLTSKQQANLDKRNAKLAAITQKQTDFYSGKAHLKPENLLVDALGRPHRTQDGRTISYATTAKTRAAALARGEVLAGSSQAAGTTAPKDTTKAPKAKSGRKGGRAARPLYVTPSVIKK